MSGEAKSSGLTFFMDRGLGAFVVPSALRDCGWAVETMDERYGTATSQRLADHVWLADATANGDVVLAKDTAIARQPVEARTIFMSQAQVFALTSARMTGRDMAERFLAFERAIVEMASGAQGPYVVAVGSDGLRRLPLAYP